MIINAKERGKEINKKYIPVEFRPRWLPLPDWHAAWAHLGDVKVKSRAVIDRREISAYKWVRRPSGNQRPREWTKEPTATFLVRGGGVGGVDVMEMVVIIVGVVMVDAMEIVAIMVGVVMVDAMVIVVMKVMAAVILLSAPK